MILDEYYYRLYLKLNKEKSFVLAEKALDKAASLNAKIVYIYELSQLLKRRGQWWQVLEILGQALKLEINPPLLWNLAYIEALEKMNRFLEVTQEFKQIENSLVSVNDYFRYARALYEIGDREKFDEILNKVIELDDKYNSKALGIGIFYEKKGEWVKAVECYSEKIINEPFNISLNYKLGLALDRNYRWSEAQKQISYTIALGKSKSYFFNRLAFNYERNQQYLKASELYRLTIFKEKLHKPHLYYRLGYTLYQANEFKASCEAFLGMKEVSLDNFEDSINNIENKIKQESKLEIEQKLQVLIDNICVKTEKKELNEIITIAKNAEAWSVLENLYLHIIKRDENLESSNFFFLGKVLYHQKKYRAAAQQFINQKIIQNVQGVSENKLEKDRVLSQHVYYAEFFMRERVESRSIIYESDFFTEESMLYKVSNIILNNKKFNNWQHIFVVDNKEILENNDRFKNIIFVTKGSWLYLKYLASVEFLINDGSIPSYFIRKKSQKYLSLAPMDLALENTSSYFNETRSYLQATAIFIRTKKFLDTYKTHYNINGICVLEEFLSIDDYNLENNLKLFFQLPSNDKGLQTSNKKTLLLFSPLEINGIGASFLNLLVNIDLDKYLVTIVIDNKKYFSSLTDLDSRINVILRTGNMLLTLEEQWVRGRFLTYSKLESREMKKLYQKMFEREFQRIFGIHQFDTIIDFHGYRIFWTSLFAFGHAKQKIIYLHSDMKKESELRFKSLESIFNLYSYFDKLVSVSETTSYSNKNALQKKYLIDEKKFTFIPNPLDAYKYKKLSSVELKSDCFKTFSNDKRKKFINVGRLSPEKGQEVLIDVFTKVVEQNNQVSLYIIGSGILKKKLENLIKEKNMEKYIFLLGEQQNPYPFIKNSDCMILTSKYEGQSLVLLEALVLGIPCISTDIPGPRSILENGIGILSEEDSLSITKSIEIFLENKYTLIDFDAVEYNKESLQAFYNMLTSKNK